MDDVDSNFRGVAQPVEEGCIAQEEHKAGAGYGVRTGPRFCTRLFSTGESDHVCSYSPLVM